MSGGGLKGGRLMSRLSGGSCWIVLIFQTELALANLKPITVKNYREVLQRYVRFCERCGWDELLSEEAVEAFVWEMWCKGRKKQTPESFRSAMRKMCDVMGVRDLFMKKTRLMIDAFELDYPERELKFLPVEDFEKILDVVGRSSREDWKELVVLMNLSIWHNVRIGTLKEIMH